MDAPGRGLNTSDENCGLLTLLGGVAVEYSGITDEAMDDGKTIGVTVLMLLIGTELAFFTELCDLWILLGIHKQATDALCAFTEAYGVPLDLISQA